MHEWGITQDLIDELIKQAKSNNIKQVTKVEIALGKKSDISALSLKTCFKALANDEILKNCKLNIKKIPDNKIIINKITGQDFDLSHTGSR